MNILPWILLALSVAIGPIVGYWLSSRKYPITLEEQRRVCEIKADEDLRELERDLEGQHTRRMEEKDFEIRRATARAEDAERLAERYKVSYKNALTRLRRLRTRLARSMANLRAAGLAQDSAPNEDGSPKLDSVQGIMDSAISEIPGMDDMAQGAVRAYVERELRKRGSKHGPQILEEVLAGDTEE